MKILGDKIIIHKGEAFNLNLNVKDELGQPYVLLNVENPYLCISVKSTVYPQDGDYNFNTWIQLGDSYFKAKTKDIDFCLQSEVNEGISINDERNNTICRLSNIDEYYKVENGIFMPYEFKVHKKFLPLYTSKWLEGEYNYSISVVGGSLLTPVLQTWYKQIYHPEREIKIQLPTDNKFLYDKIKQCRPDLVENINYNQPFASISYRDWIIKEKKLIIK